tara:strand:- start:144 stop:656 length:513 start_codon:yes stop_codon:yes gene_type:complete
MITLDKIATNIQVILANTLIRLGRNASGAFINSLSHKIVYGSSSVEIIIQGLNYWRIIEYGTPAKNIPYGTKRTGKGNSKYIQGLMNWIKTKGLARGNKTVKAMAFAIATKQTSTNRGGWGYGNPMDKRKLGFIRKSQSLINAEENKLQQMYQGKLDEIAEKHFVKKIDF